MLRKTFGVDELQCCSDVEVLVCKAIRKKMFKYWWPKTTTRWALCVVRWALGVGRDALGVGRDALCVKVPEKKSAWTDLDRVDFEKKSSMSKSNNRLGQV